MYFAISCVYGRNVFALFKWGVQWFSQFSLSFCLLEFWFCERRIWSVMHFLAYSQWEYKSTFHFLAKLLSSSLHLNCVFTCSSIRCAHCCERHGHGRKRFLLDLMGYTASLTSFDVIAVRFNYRFNCISSDYRSCILDWNSPAIIKTLDWSGWEDHAFCPVFMSAKEWNHVIKHAMCFTTTDVGNQFTIEFGCTNHLIPFPLWSMWKYISFDSLLCLVLLRFEALFWSLLFTHSTLPLKVFANHILRSTTKSLLTLVGFCDFVIFQAIHNPTFNITFEV